MKQRRIAFSFLVCAVMGWQAHAQSFDTSGNGMLNGSFYFRQVYVASDFSDLTSAYGEISFNGSGGYTLSASAYDYSQGGPLALSSTGTYSISASGLGYISNPLSKGSLIYGLVSQGIFIGSSTQNAAGFNDMFIAAPIGAATPAFSGNYSIAYTDMYLGISGSYQLNPNGSNVGSVNVKYYGINSNGAFYSGTLNEGTVGYKASSGAEVLSFPNGNQNLPILGSEYLYVSPDGNFVFGGSPTGWDFFVGVKPTATPAFSGLYYQAGFDLSPDGYYGSFDAIPSLGQILGHQRVLPLGSTFQDYTYSDALALNADGSFDDGFAIHHVFGLGGALSVGFGTDGTFGINVALKATPPSGSGMYLNPIGIQNQSSSALFTAGIAAGEYITLTGTGLVTGTHQDITYPTILGGIELLVNGRAAPLYYMCQACDAGQDLIIAVVPWEMTGTGVVQFQVVTTGGARSNQITLFQSQTAPGVKTQAGDGLGDAAAQHLSNFNLITPANPAQVGETIVVYAVGLGTTSPLLNDGQAAGSSILSVNQQPISVFIDGVQATIVGGSAVLVPSIVNLYQLNVVVPSGVSSGEVFVDIQGPDSYTSQATIDVGTGGVAAAARPEKPRHRRPGTTSKITQRLRPNLQLPE